jgi:hypothetical protein
VGPDGTVSLVLPPEAFADGNELPLGPQRIQITSYDAEGKLVIVDMMMTVAQGPVRPLLDPATSELPTLSSGQSSGSSGGRPSPVESLWLADERLVTLGGSGWSVSFSFDESATVGTDQAPAVSAPLNSEGTLGGDGLLPESTASVWVFPGPTLLGEVTVDPDGSFSIDYLLDARVLSPGQYTLQVQGIGADGLSRSINVGIDIAEESAPASTTSRASTLVTVAGVTALALVGVTTSIFFVLRRRGRKVRENTR